MRHSWGTMLLLLSLLLLQGEGENLHGMNNDRVPRFAPSTLVMEEEPTPYFHGHGQTYRVKEGEAVTLECMVENLGSSVIVWKQVDRIISAGPRLIRKDGRMKLIPKEKGISLRISSVSPEDRGEYICELETYGDPVHQTNQLEVLIPPSVSVLNNNNFLSIHKGSTVKLACNASGYPAPRITWQREYQMLPSGEKHVDGSSLVLTNVSRHDAGDYICTAANGVDRAVSRMIRLNVVYEPEIELDKAWVHADIGVEVKISCVIYADPPAEVRWYRETMLLAQNENRMMEKFGHRHWLVIHKATNNDFGNYSCRAENTLGKAKAFIEVSGNPNRAEITSPSLSFSSDRYNLTWNVFSYSPIISYRILYRKVIPEHDPNFDLRSRWHNVVPKIDQIIDHRQHSKSNDPLQSGSYMFYALEPNNHYEVVVQAENKWGWSRNSQPFFFSTRPTDFSPKVDASQPKSRDGSTPLEDSINLNSASKSAVMPSSDGIFATSSSPSSSSFIYPSSVSIFAICLILQRYY